MQVSLFVLGLDSCFLDIQNIAFHIQYSEFILKSSVFIHQKIYRSVLTGIFMENSLTSLWACSVRRLIRRLSGKVDKYLFPLNIVRQLETVVKTGDKIRESGYYTIKGHVDPTEAKGDCEPYPTEQRRYFAEGVKAHKMVVCGHSVEWAKVAG